MCSAEVAAVLRRSCYRAPPKSLPCSATITAVLRCFSDQMTSSFQPSRVVLQWGYLAPKYTTTRKVMVSHSNHQGAELCRYEAFGDAKLEKNFVEPEAAMLGKMALLCTHESPSQRPTIETLMQELNGISYS